MYPNSDVQISIMQSAFPKGHLREFHFHYWRLQMVQGSANVVGLSL